MLRLRGSHETRERLPGLEARTTAMPAPEIRYARSGDIRLAYNKWGRGPRLMLILDLISNVEVIWEHELYRRSLEYLGKHMTRVPFDKREIGISDRFGRAPTLDLLVARNEALF